LFAYSQSRPTAYGDPLGLKRGKCETKKDVGNVVCIVLETALTVSTRPDLNPDQIAGGIQAVRALQALLPLEETFLDMYYPDAGGAVRDAIKAFMQEYGVFIWVKVDRDVCRCRRLWYYLWLKRSSRPAWEDDVEVWHRCTFAGDATRDPDIVYWGDPIAGKVEFCRKQAVDALCGEYE
jgi:hypothetical protein